MQLVDTPTPDPDRFARTADGKIDFEAYKGLNATYRTGELDFMVTILDSRQRFGHLDLLITPEYGAGERWTEFKNLVLHDDPAQWRAAVFSSSPEIEVEPESVPETLIAVLTEVAEQSNTELVEATTQLENSIAEGEAYLAAPISVPATPEPGPHGTHWTEVAPLPVAVTTQEVEAPASTDIEDEVAAILGNASPHVK
jgi:hypothetical protein